MKLFKRNNASRYSFSRSGYGSHKTYGPLWCLVLAIALPLTLIIPNAMLSVTESMGFWGGLANVCLPLGVFGLLMSLSRRTGISALWFIPLMILAAFQIVLLFLYGESLIAVDMFLNVVTTNPQEVEELLGNLLTAIFTVVVIYLPVIVLSIVSAVKRWRLDVLVRDAYRKVSVSIAVIGFVAMVVSYIITPTFGVTHDIFPINGLTNLGIAVKRSVDMANYTKTSADWTYNAHSLRADTIPEVYILVIGETTRADNWQLAGYERETNPRLSQLTDMVFFNRALTQSNTTHKSVPMLLSSLTADDFGDNINLRKGLITAFNEAGFDTYFFSNQRRNHSYIDHFGEEADTSVFIKDDGKEHYDEELLPLLSNALADGNKNKKLIVLHTYGSHFNYRDRYPDEFSYFRPDNRVDASERNRPELVNAYDNTVRYVDDFLADINDQLLSTDMLGAILYASDHGEDIYDDYRGRFLHASPTPTYTQLHVPMLVALMPRYAAAYPEMSQALKDNSGKYVSSTASVFHTLMQLAGIDAQGYDPQLSVASADYKSPSPIYLTDRNESVDLRQSGLKPIDIERLDSLGIRF